MSETELNKESEFYKKAQVKAKTNLVYISLFAVVMLFGGFTSAFLVSRGAGFWVSLQLPTSLIYSTVTIAISSITMVLALVVVKKGNKKQYAWNDEERAAIMKEFGESSKIQRYKGLGEMNAEQLWDTTMNPEFRTLRQIQIDNGVEADRVFSMLMGDEVPPRREFIEKNAIYANIDA